jgi:hypothetical protein
MIPLKHLLALFSIIIFLVTCETKKQTPISTESIVFQTTDQSELFFKNIRQSSYRLTEMKTAGINIFYPSAFENEEWIIRPYLVHNWRIDKAFLMLEIKDSLITPKFEIGKVEIQKLVFIPETHLDQAIFGLQVYNSIIQHDSIFVLDHSGKLLPVFPTNELKEAYRITCVDFLQLVGLLQ